ncbi:hypothetical protein [Spongiactinospora sp. TRM90649]|uniref:hypothetical protein n=1 Tax=Spongiactinospora sp. TRM90649 TaxID=3031114 RepID=UPI0023F66D4B|nr:hypothetical protein [Spongiactinospora sp. TRM90649]MDF5753040.1 hypothetical protein [Spongiactinospora sp. TRM90649]
MSSRLGLGIVALAATFSLAAPASASASSTYIAGIRVVSASADQPCERRSDLVTYARVSCATSQTYRVEAEYCRPGSCTWHNGNWATNGAWSSLSGFSGGGFTQIQERLV